MLGRAFFFSKLNHSGYEKELKRHNFAIKQRQRAKENWYENEAAKKDRIQKLIIELQDAKEDINRTNYALGELRSLQRMKYSNVEFNREPQLSDFYKPSDEMKEYQLLVVSVVGLKGGNIIPKLI